MLHCALWRAQNSGKLPKFSASGQQFADFSFIKEIVTQLGLVQIGEQHGNQLVEAGDQCRIVIDIDHIHSNWLLRGLQAHQGIEHILT